MVLRHVPAPMVESWSESMTARERVETIATTLTEPRTANWIAGQADVKWDTAKKHLDDLAESGVLLVTEDGTYVPDPTRAYFDQLRELILTNDREELRAELEAIADRIDGWKTTYEVSSPTKLEETLAGDLPADEVRDRRQALRRWENSVRSRDTIRTALRLYDDVEALTDDVPANVRLEGAG